MKPKILTDISNLNNHTKNQGNPHKVDSLQTNLVPRYNYYAFDKDANSIFKKIEFRSLANKIIAESLLSAPNILGYYETQTINIYGEDGISIAETIKYAISYDNDGDVISKVVI